MEPLDPQHAGAELGVLSLLRGAEKHIPMIDGAVDFENRQGAKAFQQAARSGVTAIEYALITSLIAVFVITALQTVGTKISTVFTEVGNALK